MLRELVAQPHCIHVYSSCKVAIKYVYTKILYYALDQEAEDRGCGIGILWFTGKTATCEEKKMWTERRFS